MLSAARPVVLSEAKDLHLVGFTMFRELQILLFAQDDRRRMVAQFKKLSLVSLCLVSWW
jgi:hypothetical protein